MLTLIQSTLAAQYGASLRMLQTCIDRADPADVWLAPVGRVPFWHVAYHTLFYTDFYLSPDEQSFRPQPFHRENYNFLGPQAWAPHLKVVTDQPYDKQTLLAYLDDCRAKAKRTLDRETEATLAGPSGFHWVQLPRLELHLYNLRHVQHHAGQLGAALRRQQDRAVEWACSEPL
jgi:hypothetical protein